MKVFKKLNLYKTACPLSNVVKKADITNMLCYDEIPVTKITMQTLPCPCYKLSSVINKLLSQNKRSLTNVHGTSLDYKSNSTTITNLEA
jgi:hypothetical protein